MLESKNKDSHLAYRDVKYLVHQYLRNLKKDEKTNKEL